MNKLYSFSIVICSYNGANKISNAISSLQNQDYKGEYEIVVINDKSTDNTYEICKNLGAKVFTTTENKGLSNARNLGLAKAKNQIYVCFDDDCLANKDWLTQLNFTYNMQGNALGIGSSFISQKELSFTNKYIEESGYTKPILPYIGKSKSALGRLYSYYVSMFKSWENPKEDVFEVVEIAGGLSSFFRKDLEKVGGWRTEVSGYEDVDLCLRLKKQFPDRDFYINSKALLTHDHQLGLLDYIRKHYLRSGVRLRYYLLNKITPPIYPFPFLVLLLDIVATLLASLIVNYSPYFQFLLLGTAYLISPLIAYHWWPIKSLKKMDASLLSFSWVQFIYESAILLGMLKAYIFGQKKITR